MEKAYKFREELLQIHKPDIRDNSRKTKENEYEFKNGVIISIPKNAGDVIAIAANDFADFLKTSMGICAKVEEDCQKGDVVIGIASDSNVDLGEYAHYSGLGIHLTDDIIEKYPYMPGTEQRFKVENV